MDGAWAYGLGLARITMSCGAELGGHTGGLSGTVTYDGVVPATGRAITIALNQDLMDDRYHEGSRALDAAACSAP